jgi:hypothetical protein
VRDWRARLPGLGHTGDVGLFDRLRPSADRAAARDGEAYLREWVEARRGVEGFVEPRTAVSEITLLLVAHDGEWTRRQVRSVDWAHDFCNRHRVPSYDAAVVGVPQRMREYNRRAREQERRRRQS